MNILLTTLGGSWAIVPELVGFTNPELVNTYKNHPESGSIESARREADIRSVDEVWVVTTDGAVSRKALADLRECWEMMPASRPHIRAWTCKGIDEMRNSADFKEMQELIFLVILHASAAVDTGQLILSLAGGRKTMSADLQRGASVFGHHALLHVAETGNASSVSLRNPAAAIFSSPLPEDVAIGILPLVAAGKMNRSALLDMPGERSGKKVDTQRFPLPVARPNDVPMQVAVSTDLAKVIDERLRRAHHLLFHYGRSLSDSEESSTFRALYVLPPEQIEFLKTKRFGCDPAKAGEELAFLRRLPKTDLHCHLGGVLDAKGLIEVAISMEQDFAPYRTIVENSLKPWFGSATDLFRLREEMSAKFGATRFLQGFRENMAQSSAGRGIPVWAWTVGIIRFFDGMEENLDRLIFGEYLNEEKFVQVPFDAYEGFGDLQGSALLQTESAIRQTCRNLLQKAVVENVRYLEIRCSPVNYTRGGLSDRRVLEIIREELARRRSEVDTSLILIASRHGRMSDVWRHIELALELIHSSLADESPLAGFDLAGSEKMKEPGRLREAFLPIMEKCLHLTVHAGETDSVKRIWDAVYHLSAERIGHGLNLLDDVTLLEHLLDRRIAVEMCPSSNLQIVGFRDTFLPCTDQRPLYPLQAYLERGLRATVNTDNPGISRTGSTLELHRAARLSQNGLSLWQILKIIQNGFKASFAPYSLRRRLLLKAEREMSIIIEEAF
ncbi:MAG: hypothetical protein HQM09_14440 [Candidatus Riflebacteria bacterium]|nr:hypothetical protein [Candidatus Riflebacteria bacterium]